MKSSFILSSLLSLAIASPIIPRDECACPSVMCLQSFPDSCECEADALSACAKTLPSTCDQSVLEQSDACIAALETPKPINRHNTTTPTNSTSPLGQKCGSWTYPNCPAGYKCSYDDNPPYITDLPGICVLRNATSGVGDSCGSRGQKPCPRDLYCDMSGVDPKIADAPGKCAIRPVNGTLLPSTGRPTHTEKPNTLPFRPTGVISHRPTFVPGNHTSPIGQGCGSKGLEACPTGFKCSFAAVPSGVMDWPGKCVPATGSIGLPVTSKRPTPVATTYTHPSISIKPTLTPIPIPSASVSHIPNPSGSVCGGFAGVECGDGLSCVLDRKCVESNTSDCQGRCIVAGSAYVE